VSEQQAQQQEEPNNRKIASLAGILGGAKAPAWKRATVTQLPAPAPLVEADDAADETVPEHVTTVGGRSDAAVPSSPLVGEGSGAAADGPVKKPPVRASESAAKMASRASGRAEAAPSSAKFAERPAPAPPKPVPAGDESRRPLRSIAIYLPRSVHIMLGDWAKAQNVTRTAVILTAVDQTHERLGDALAPEQIRPGGLFAIPQAKAASTGEGSVETKIRVTDSQVAVLDSLAETYTTSRSRLIATAVRLYIED